MKISVLCIVLLLAAGVARAEDIVVANTPGAIPRSEVGAKAGADYKGDGLAMTPTESVAHLHCIFQRLDGEATREGLWLTSTVTNTECDCFRVTAMEVGRKAADAPFNPQPPESSIPLAGAGEVSVDGQTVRFSRPGLTEEYSVSLDGVRQDFIVEQSPPEPPAGDLVVKLAVDGAKVEPAAHGARLVLENSGRRIAYSHVRAADATGRQLPAWIEVCPVPDSAAGDFLEEMRLFKSAATDIKLAVVVNDADAVYPVRIDPTFSDGNWISMGAGDGANGPGAAAVADGSGNLYIGGDFTNVGNADATYIAKWNGSSWSALGSGMNSTVYALAISGSTLYAGGDFTNAGGIAANYIAQWNGSSWSALGSGLSGTIPNQLGPEGGDQGGPYVAALAVSGGTLYAGGYFTTAGGDTNANCIAQWNGTNWSPLTSGVSGATLGAGYFFNGPWVSALAVSGSMLYAGGTFTSAGGTAANCIAQWNGTNWSALGSGVSGIVFLDSFNEPGPWVSALAVSGGTLYAGGAFTMAGGETNANCIAQWNGSGWSRMGLGVSGANFMGTGPAVGALAVSASTLYLGGNFTIAGDDTDANYIAQWDGTNWSGLGSGMNGPVNALAASGGMLYAGGDFTTAGTNSSYYIAEAILPVSISIITANAAFGLTNGVFGFDVSGPSGSSVVVQASTDLQTWIPLQTNVLGGQPLYFSDSQSPTNVRRFYRAQSSP